MTIRLPRRQDLARRSLRRRGGAGVKILLVLSALFLLLGVGGLVVASRAVSNDLVPTIKTLVKNVESSDTVKHVVSPGEAEIESTGNGGMLVVIPAKSTVDGKEYTYAPGGKLTITLTAADGTPTKVEPIEGIQPIQVENGPDIYIHSFAPIKGAGKYTVAVDGQETAVNVITVTGGDWDKLTGGVMRAFGGGLSACCGFPLFLLFGIIGGIILIFGKKPAPMP